MANAVDEIFWVGLNHVFDWILVLIFFLVTTLLNMYALSKFRNICRTLIATRCFTDKPKQGGNIKEGEEPMVTIQISCFNEGNVIEDTINAACDVDWPKDKLCVQICDDSTDETIMIIDSVCARWKERGVNCERLTRPNRIGYKAGCLHYHTDRIQGDFVAMFDADHRCENQFLRRCVPHFYTKKGRPKRKVGLVQCPWAYYNTHANILTEYDALNLDTAFVLEQTGRSEVLGVFSFNGTGGIWRKQAIQAGGGWSWETITEDLDLSYESYMAGYEFVYLRDLPQQLELPAGIRAHVQQKFRWTKGFFQVARKTLFRIFRNPLTPILLKLEVFFQYTGAIAYTLTLVVVMMAPILSARKLFSPFLVGYTLAPTVVPLVGGTCTIFGKVSGSNGQYKSFRSRCKRMLFIPLLYMFALGMMIFETYAIYDGLTSDDATFVRTPKEGTPVAGDQKLDYKDDEDECRNDEDMTGDINGESGNNSGDEGNTDTASGDIEQGANAPMENQEEEEEEVTALSSWPKLQLPKLPRCWPKLTKKGQKFLTNFTNGMLGLLVGFYLCCWCIVLYLEQRKARSSTEKDTMGVIMTFALPIPAIGLFYVHGTFMYQLLSMKFKNMWKKRVARQEMKEALRLKMRAVDDGADDGATVVTEALSAAATLRSHRTTVAVDFDVEVNEENGEMSLVRYLESGEKSVVAITDADMQSISSVRSSISFRSAGLVSPLKSPMMSPRKRERRAGRKPRPVVGTKPKVNWSDLSALSDGGQTVLASIAGIDLNESIPVEADEEEEKREDDDTDGEESSKYDSSVPSHEGGQKDPRYSVYSDAFAPLPHIMDDPGSDLDSIAISHQSPMPAIDEESMPSPGLSAKSPDKKQSSFRLLAHSSLRSLRSAMMGPPKSPQRSKDSARRHSLGASLHSLTLRRRNSQMDNSTTEEDQDPPIPGIISFNDSSLQIPSIHELAIFETSSKTDSDDEEYLNFSDGSMQSDMDSLSNLDSVTNAATEDDTTTSTNTVGGSKVSGRAIYDGSIPMLGFNYDDDERGDGVDEDDSSNNSIESELIEEREEQKSENSAKPVMKSKEETKPEPAVPQLGGVDLASFNDSTASLTESVVSSSVSRSFPSTSISHPSRKFARTTSLRDITPSLPPVLAGSDSSIPSPTSEATEETKMSNNEFSSENPASPIGNHQHESLRQLTSATFATGVNRDDDGIFVFYDACDKSFGSSGEGENSSTQYDDCQSHNSEPQNADTPTEDKYVEMFDPKQMIPRFGSSVTSLNASAASLTASVVSSSISRSLHLSKSPKRESLHDPKSTLPPVLAEETPVVPILSGKMLCTARDVVVASARNAATTLRIRRNETLEVDTPDNNGNDSDDDGDDSGEFGHPHSTRSSDSGRSSIILMTGEIHPCDSFA